MQAYWNTIEDCVQPEPILEAMRTAGFESLRFRLVVPGAFYDDTAPEPAESG